MANTEDGNVSEWNEGNFKSKRLHEIQELINFLISRPFEKSLSTNYNFEEALPQVGVLYDEGRPKYSTHEKQEVDLLQETTEYTLKKYPVYHRKVTASFGQEETKIIFNNTNFETYKRLLRQFNRKVRDYNDEHGLSTKNKGEFDGLF